MGYPLVNVYIAIENGWFIVSLPIDSMVIFHSYVNVYQRVIDSPVMVDFPLGKSTKSPTEQSQRLKGLQGAPVSCENAKLVCL